MDIEEIKGKVVKVIDSSIISLCLSLFEWAKFRTAKGGIKIHTGLDYALMLPDLVNISEALYTINEGISKQYLRQEPLLWKTNVILILV